MLRFSSAVPLTKDDRATLEAFPVVARQSEVAMHSNNTPSGLQSHSLYSVVHLLGVVVGEHCRTETLRALISDLRSSRSILASWFYAALVDVANARRSADAGAVGHD